MGLTPVAVTQYLNSSRGDNTRALEESNKIQEWTSAIARDLKQGESQPDMMLLKMCMVCQIVRMEGLIYELHMQAMPELRSVQKCACSLGLINSIDTLETNQ